MTRSLTSINYLFLIAAFLFAAKVQGQDKDDLIRNEIENLQEGQSNGDLTEAAYWITYYYNNPLNLNTAIEEELARIPGLNPLQIKNLIIHRQKFGNLLSVYELQQIEGWDNITMHRILPIISVNDMDNASHNRPKNEFYTKAGYSWPKPTGYQYPNSNLRYKGSPYGLMTRFNYRSDNFNFGITAEKDPGEEFFMGSNAQGFDFYSGFMQFHGGGIVKNAIVGDFNVQWGQGLVAWNSFSVSKSADITRTARIATGFTPKRSTNEFDYFRGVAATVGKGYWQLSVFYSKKPSDGTITDSSDIENPYITSVYETGYHRNASEIAKKHAFFENSMGANLEYNRPHLSIGVNGINYSIDGALAAPARSYSVFTANNSTSTLGGIHFNATIRNIYLFGETAKNFYGGSGIIAGVLTALTSRLDGVILYRNYSQTFISPFGNAFSENTSDNNEQGLYTGLNWKPIRKWQVKGYTDMFRFPWLKYRVNSPSTGYSYLLEADYQPSKKTMLYFRYRSDNKGQNQVSANLPQLYEIVPNSTRRFRVDIQSTVSHFLDLHSRAEICQFSINGSNTGKGFLLLQDITYKTMKKPGLKISARYSLFDISSFFARIYAYEDDLPYSFSLPFFQNRGMRYYLLAEARIGRNISVFAKLAQTRYLNINEYGSGTDSVNGNFKNEIKGGLKATF